MTYEKHVAEMRRRALNARADLDGLKAELESVNEKFRAGTLGQKSYEDKARELKKKMDDVSWDAQRAILVTQNEYDKAADAWGAPDGNNIHPDIELLKGQVPLDLTDLKGLSEKHKQNSTMQRAIKAYTEKHGYPLVTDANSTDARAKKKAFESLTRYCINAVKVEFAAAFLTDEHFPAIYASHDILSLDPPNME